MRHHITIMALAVALLSTIGMVGITLSDEADAETPTVEAGSTITFTYHNLKSLETSSYNASEYIQLNSIFGWSRTLTVQNDGVVSGNTVTFTIPADSVAGAYTFREVLEDTDDRVVNEYTQSFNVTGERGGSSYNPYSGPISNPVPIGLYQNLNVSKYVAIGSEVSMDFLVIASERYTTYTLTSGSGLEVTQPTSSTWHLGGTLTGNCELKFTTTYAGTTYTVTYNFSAVYPVADHPVRYYDGYTLLFTDPNPDASITLEFYELDYTPPAKAGYNFYGWTYNGTVLHNGDIIEDIPTSGVDVYARWTEVKVDHPVNYFDYGTIVKTDLNNDFGGTFRNYTINHTLTRTGYEFLGWDTSDSATHQIYQNGAKVDVPATGLNLYAVWAQIYDHTIEFWSDGSVVKTESFPSLSQTIPYSLNYTPPAKTGYSFLGWDTSASASNVVYRTGDTLNSGTSTVRLYAVWSAQVSHPVSYYDGRHLVRTDLNTATGESVNYTVNCTPSPVGGKEFLGWSRSPAPTLTPQYANGDVVNVTTSGLSLHAVWKWAQTSPIVVPTPVEDTRNVFTVTPKVKVENPLGTSGVNVPYIVPTTVHDTGEKEVNISGLMMAIPTFIIIGLILFVLRAFHIGGRDGDDGDQPDY